MTIRKGRTLFQHKIDDRLQLVFLHQALAQELYDLIDNNRDYLAKWLIFPPLIKSVDDIKTFIKKSVTDFADEKAMVCGIQKDGKLVGIIGFHKILKTLKTLKKVEIGYWLAAEHQGKGIMSRACQSMIEYAFNKLEMEKVQICVASENKASRSVCERQGLTLEGIITNSENLHGKIIDHAVYGLLKTA